jgi:3-oxoacyl-[acyl-carrier protein] reductase
MLKDKFAIITGSNRGIGLSVLKKFSENNANIIACARKKNEQFEKEINSISKKFKNKIVPIYFDLLKEEEINKAVDQIKKITDSVDIIVNNAGINQVSLFQMTTLKVIREVFEVNLFSQMFFTQKLIKLMMKNKKGSIINVSSNAAKNCDSGRVAYASSKSALIAFTKVISKELGNFNIRVNSVAPGLTKTEMIEKDMKPNVIENVIKQIPMKRIANPNEISNVILFLASDLSSYVSGETISITGGY